MHIVYGLSLSHFVARKLTWYIICDWTKMLANPNNAIVLKMVMKMPPKNKKLPRLANSAEQLNDTNTTLVPTNAVTITAGSMEMTKSNSGPMVFPVKNPNPSSMPRRWLNAFGSSRDKLR